VKVYLVEHYSHDVGFDDGSLVVALNPEVCYCLDKAGVKYSIIEDYYNEADLLANEEEYYESQREWIARLDGFLQDSVDELRELSLKLGALYYPYFKTFFLDPLCLRCITLRRLFMGVKPSRIIYISRHWEEFPLAFEWQPSRRSYYSQVIPILCSNEGVPLTKVLLDRRDTTILETTSVHIGGNPAIRLARTLYERSATLRRMHFSYRYFSKRPSPKVENRESLNIFILKTVHIGIDFVIESVKRGHSVYQLSDDSILKYSTLGAKRCLHLRAEQTGRSTDSDNKDIWENTASRLEAHDLVRWVNEKCQLDVSEIVLPKLRYVISSVFPETLSYFKRFVQFYSEAGIDFVITPHLVSPVEFAAIAAANLNDVNTVCLSHGDSVLQHKYSWLLDLENYKIQISSNRLAKEYCESLCETNNLSTELYISPHRLSNVKRMRRLRATCESRIRKGRIIYLPTLFKGDSRRLERGHYPDTWYYEFQKSLISHFATMKEHVFIWKGLIRAAYPYNPIPDFIMDNNFSNIEIATNPFIEHLLSADRVICDFPGTGFYEAVVAGVPTMSLYHETFAVRKSDLEHFGGLLRLYSDIPGAIRHINDFMNSDPGLFKVTIDTGHVSIIDILENVGKEGNR